MGNEREPSLAMGIATGGAFLSITNWNRCGFRA
jgi:hypothetical protein